MYNKKPPFEITSYRIYAFCHPGSIDGNSISANNPSDM